MKNILIITYKNDLIYIYYFYYLKLNKMMEKDLIELPSDLIQKEYESNPLKIIEIMRKGRENEKKIIESNNKIDKIKENIIQINKYFIFTHEKEKEDIYIYSKTIDDPNKINKDKNIDTNINNINILKNVNINKKKDYNINNHYLTKSENLKLSNDKIPNISKNYLGNIINIDNFAINNYINFSNKNNKYVLLNNIKILLMYLNSQKGSIFTQDILDEIDEKQLLILFKHIVPYISEIMCYEYGNYFIQKLIKKLNTQQRLIIYQIIEPNFIQIATNKSGTHSIQALIECIDSPLELLALDILLNKNMLLLFLDENAYHIIMKIILEIKEEKRNNLNMFLVLNVEKIIINCNGAFCVNKFIYKNNDLKLRTLLIQNLQNNIQSLIINEYSCKILFLVLERFGIKYGLFIIKYIQYNFAYLSSHPKTIFLIIKTLYYLNNYNIFELGILIWFIYKNKLLLKYLLSHENGLKLLNLLINLSDDEQKKYIFLKINEIQKIKDD